MGNFPLAFEPNQGQASAGTLYTAKGHGYSLNIHRDGADLVLHRSGKSAKIQSHLVGGSASARVKGTDRLPGVSNYFRGADRSQWITGIPTYAKARAAAVYPGIDLIYYGNQGKLEYDFVVQPGADASAIRMKFDGVSGMRVDEAGNLHLATTVGDLIEHKPVLYQTAGEKTKPVDGSFRIAADRTVAFEVGPYDRSKALVIDPVLMYSSFLGGSDTDEGHAVAAGNDGALYLTGVTYSTQYGDADVMIYKISTDGTYFVYTANLGGSSDDIGNGIAVDQGGNVYVGGRTLSTDFPTANAYQSTNYGQYNNAFVLKLDGSGTNLLYSTYFGGSFDDQGFALALDSQGNAYLTGGETSTDFPVSNNAYQSNNRGGVDCFVAKFDNNGNPVFSTLIGGGSDDQAFGIAVDANGNSYITGQTVSDSYPQVSPSVQHSRHGGLDAFVTAVSPDGSSLIFSTFAGGGSDDYGNGVAVDPSGNVVVVGTTSSDDFPTTSNAYKRGYAGGASDGFVLSYTPDGQTLLYSTFIGSHGTDDANSVAIDAAGNVYIAGDTDSDQYPVTGDATQHSRGGYFDATLSVLTHDGSNLLFSTFLGGSQGDESAYGVAVDTFGNAYLTGFTSSPDFPATPGAAQTSPGGGDQDAFFARISFGTGSGGAVTFVTPGQGAKFTAHKVRTAHGKQAAAKAVTPGKAAAQQPARPVPMR